MPCHMTLAWRKIASGRLLDTGKLKDLHRKWLIFIIDREAREIMYLVASVHASVCLSVCQFVSLSELSCLNRLTFDLHSWYGGRP